MEDGTNGSGNEYFYIQEDLIFSQYEGNQVPRFEIMIKATSTTGHTHHENISLHFNNLEQNSFDSFRFEYLPDTQNMEHTYGSVIIGNFVLEKKNQQRVLSQSSPGNINLQNVLQYCDFTNRNNSLPPDDNNYFEMQGSYLMFSPTGEFKKNFRVNFNCKDSFGNEFKSEVNLDFPALKSFENKGSM